VSGLLLPKDSSLHVSGAAARVAEGGAEFVPMVRLGRPENAIEQLRAAGFTIAATVVRGGTSLFKSKLPERLVYILGAEQSGVDSALAPPAACAWPSPAAAQSNRSTSRPPPRCSWPSGCASTERSFVIQPSRGVVRGGCTATRRARRSRPRISVPRR
jgi:hypothetical protein